MLESAGESLCAVHISTLTTCGQASHSSHTPTPADMAPRLTETIKREIELDAAPYTVSIGPTGVHIAPKGKRKGHELSWRSLASGEAELNRDLVRSLAARSVKK